MAPPAGATCAHHLFTVVLDPEVDRDAFRAALSENGVQTSMHYPPVHGFSIYADLPAELPVTVEYAQRAVTLPMYATMTDEQRVIVVDEVRRALA